ncbi:MAG: MBL fold metallo-hydrolase [Candidatus Eisenbacteria bacterium]|nr:MBL fold metallo-hydrolase [Candidatus Eisenbacteria bacterium]
MRLGSLEVHVLHESSFRLDGGQAFGVVPRAFWEPLAPPDERHRVRLGVHPLLVRSGPTWALVDTGIGERTDARFRDIYAIEDDAPVRGLIRAFGVEPGDIGLVVLSHLHFDHAGGATRRDGAGPLPAFPNARVVMDRGEWHDAHHPVEFTRGGYRGEDLECLEAAAEWVGPDEDAEPLPGVHFVRAPGHTAHHRGILLRSGGRAVFYPVDLLPLTPHVRLPWIAALDHHPLTVLETKRRFLARACAEGWWVCFAHHPGTATFGRIVARDGAWALQGPLKEEID